MAETMILDSKLKILFEIGLNEKGEPLYKAKTYNNIDKNVTADKLFETAQALGQLSIYPVLGVERTDSFEIVG
ncbi:DUF1659 domain-containing protein [Robertmurraya sp. DFI.2.37]|jgi:hypothetical protein|uniref:DUF1659 domain-containing protein n=1 Tax=Robertmurraya sp. DFI.2.37 TaxID=3031819 RepID=UPI001247CBDB|nr:DUF1659 domain-containing protein [Robertmurraya sp. DFI.2.37]MDF1507133.1 DUF1659 domain-containing protein [Robertmurraya sp. DFI.2.37]